VIVSCGTCLDQLEHYEFEKIFPAALLDIHEYLLEKGVKLAAAWRARATCITSPATRDEAALRHQGRERADGRRRESSPTAAAASPARSRSRVRRVDASPVRKEEEMRKGVDAIRGKARSAVKVLTSCPSCSRGCRGTPTTRCEGRLHRGRDREARARPRLDAELRGPGECGGHRARPALKRSPSPAALPPRGRGRFHAPPDPSLPQPGAEGPVGPGRDASHSDTGGPEPQPGSFNRPRCPRAGGAVAAFVGPSAGCHRQPGHCFGTATVRTGTQSGTIPAAVARGTSHVSRACSLLPCAMLSS